MQRPDFFSDWIDVDGNGRSYFYLDTNLLAIVFDIVDPATAQTILKSLDLGYQRLVDEFNVTRDQIYASPSNMYNVSTPGDQVLPQYPFPNYENGGSFWHITAFEIAARGKGGQVDEANKVFKRIITRGYDVHHLWSAGLDWKQNQLYSEPLTSSPLLIWAYIRGVFGVWTDLLNGIQVINQPPAELEGANHIFQHLGKDYQLIVIDGQSVVFPV